MAAPRAVGGIQLVVPTNDPTGKAAKQLVVALPDSIALARGDIAGWSGVNKFGANPAQPNGTFEDQWDGSANYVFQANAVAMEMVTSGQDTAAGTGAQSVTIIGQGDDGVEISQTVATNAGTQAIPLPLRRVYRAWVETAGSGGTNANDITIQVTAGGQDQAVILATTGQTLMSIYTIPTGFKGWLTKYRVEAGAAAAAATMQVELQTRVPGGAWRTRDRGTVRTDGNSIHMYEFAVALELPAGSDIKIRVNSDVNATESSGGFTIYLEEL